MTFKQTISTPSAHTVPLGSVLQQIGALILYSDDRFQIEIRLLRRHRVVECILGTGALFQTASATRCEQFGLNQLEYNDPPRRAVMDDTPLQAQSIASVQRVQTVEERGIVEGLC